MPTPNPTPDPTAAQYYRKYASFAKETVVTPEDDNDGSSNDIEQKTSEDSSNQFAQFIAGLFEQEEKPTGTPP